MGKKRKFDRMELSYGSTLLDHDRFNSPDDIPSRILIASTKPFFTEDGRDYTLRREELMEMVRNFEEGVLGVKVPVNYEHFYSSRANSTPAAGWIKALEAEEIDESISIYATIEWTKNGRRKVFEREYLYHSIGFYFNFTSMKDGETEYGRVLYELTLTNNPVNTNLGEFLENNKKPEPSEDEDMDLKEALAKIGVLEEQLRELKKENETKVVEMSKRTDENTKLKDDLEKSRKELKDSQDKLELSKRETELEKLVLAKKITPAQRDGALKLSSAEYVGFKSFAENAKPGAYNTEPNAEGNEPNGDGGESNIQENAKSADEQVDEMAKKMMEKNKDMKYQDAVAQVLKKNKALADRFNKGN